MKRLNDVIETLDERIISNEKYYNLIKFQEYLEDLSDETIEVVESVLTPYYIFDGKRMELYEYALNIETSKKQDFEEYLLTLTGKQRMDDIPRHIIEREKECRIECEENTKIIRIFFLKKYIHFLLTNTDIKSQVKKIFRSFSEDNLFFELFLYQ